MPAIDSVEWYRSAINRAKHEQNFAYAGMLTDEALGHYPDDPYIICFKARDLIRLGRKENNKKLFEDAKTLLLAVENPDNILLTTLGNACLRLDELGPALEYANRALAIAPNDKWALDLHATISARQGRFSEAIIDHEKRLDVNPDSQRAADALSVAVQRRNRVDALTAQVTIAKANRNYDLADRVNKEALALFPKEPFFLTQKAERLIRMGRQQDRPDLFREAKAVLSEIENPTASALTIKAKAHFRLKEMGPALAIVKRVTKDNSRFQPAWDLQYAILRDLGRFPEAIQAAEMLLIISPDSPRSADAMKNILEMQARAAPGETHKCHKSPAGSGKHSGRHG